MKFVTHTEVVSRLNHKGGNRYQCPFNSEGNTNLWIKSLEDADDSWVVKCHSATCQGLPEYRRELLSELGFDTEGYGNGQVSRNFVSGLKPFAAGVSVEQQAKDRRNTIRSREIWSMCSPLGDRKADPAFNYLMSRGWDADGMADSANIRYISASNLANFGKRDPWGFGSEVQGYLVWGLSAMSELGKPIVDDEGCHTFDVSRLQFVALDRNDRQIPKSKRNFGSTKGFVWQIAGIPFKSDDWRISWEEGWHNVIVGESQSDVLLAYQQTGADAGVASLGVGNLDSINLKPNMFITVVSDPEPQAIAASKRCLRRHVDRGGEGKMVYHTEKDFADCVKAKVGV